MGIEVQVIRIQTPFETREDFVGTFSKYVLDDSCFVPSNQMKTVGVETGFSIRLADGTPVLRGLGVVLDAWSTDENPWHKPGIRIGLRKLTKDTRLVFDELQHARFARGSGSIERHEEQTAATGKEATDAAPADGVVVVRTGEYSIPSGAIYSLGSIPSTSSDAMPSGTSGSLPSVASGSISSVAAESIASAVSITYTPASETKTVIVTPMDTVPTRMPPSMDADAVPMEITAEQESQTDRVEMEDLPARGEISTLLGFAPLPKPDRAPTNRETETLLGMAPIAIARTTTTAPRITAPMPTQAPSAAPDMPMAAATVPTMAPASSLPLMAMTVSLPGLADLWELPELAALSALETTAIVERPRRRSFTQWWARLVWRVRGWYRTRSMR